MVLKLTPHVSGLSYDVVEIFLFGHPVLPVHPKWSAYQGAQVLLGDIPWRYCMCITGPSAGDTISLSMPCHQCVPSMYMCNQPVQPFVLFGRKKIPVPQAVVHFVDLVVAI